MRKGLEPEMRPGKKMVRFAFLVLINKTVVGYLMKGKIGWFKKYFFLFLAKKHIPEMLCGDYCILIYRTYLDFVEETSSLTF